MTNDRRCPVCGAKGIGEKRNEGTGSKILWNFDADLPHRCKKQTKYWCIKCGNSGAAIPIANPCIHKRIDSGEVVIPKEDPKPKGPKQTKLQF